MKFLHWTIVTAVTALFATSAYAVPAQYDLTFETNGQSMWDTGSSFQLDETKFIGVQWQDANVNLDLIVGDEDTLIPNPARIAYDIAFAACRLVASSSACINGQSFRLPVARLGSRPGVRSCGRFDIGCGIARLADIARRAAYDVAFAACRLVASSTACRNGQTGRIPVLALGSAPPSTLDIGDTRTGVAIDGTTDGRLGLELGVEIDSGSVDATVAYQANFDIPDTTGLAPGATLNFNPDSALGASSSLDTTFPTIELSVDAIMELSGSVSGEGCLIALGCAELFNESFNINERAPILSFNEDGEGGILLLGEDPSFFGLPSEADGFPVSLPAGGFATITLHLPQPDASGGLNAAGDKLEATGQDDLVDLLVDIDQIVTAAAGVPGLLGSSIDIPPNGSLGFDIINVEMGPTVDLQQDFELTPTLFVQLVFDEFVMIAGELVNFFQGAWDDLPDITFLADTTLVTPTFFIDADLENSTLLDFDLAFIIDLLQINFDLPFLGIGETSFGIGNVLDEAVDLFDTPDLFNKLFPLIGFNALQAPSFIIDFIDGSTAPSDESGRQISNSASVPEPGTLILFLVGLGLLLALRRRKVFGQTIVITARRNTTSAA